MLGTGIVGPSIQTLIFPLYNPMPQAFGVVAAADLFSAHNFARCCFRVRAGGSFAAGVVVAFGGAFFAASARLVDKVSISLI